jgi:UTP--glucose-1-phosphate uridylyltransferase
METAERTKADAKGGHLARRRSNGRLLLRESGQAPTLAGGDIIPEFQDTQRYRHFNTNNIWLDLQAVVNVARTHDGTIPLPLISNKKHVNPRDRSTRKVIQIETAMGAAIEVFEGALALQVPRRRFAPVKSNNDLLVVRSDVYELNDEYTLQVAPARTLPGLPLVQLDPQYFGLLGDFEARVKVIPSLVEAESFSLTGDLTFSHALHVAGAVRISCVGHGQSLPEHLTHIKNQNITLP